MTAVWRGYPVTALAELGDVDRRLLLALLAQDCRDAATRHRVLLARREQALLDALRPPTGRALHERVTALASAGEAIRGRVRDVVRRRSAPVAPPGPDTASASGLQVRPALPARDRYPVPVHRRPSGPVALRVVSRDARSEGGGVNEVPVRGADELVVPGHSVTTSTRLQHSRIPTGGIPVEIVNGQGETA